MVGLKSEGFISLEKSVELLPYKPRQFIEREYLTDTEIQTFTNYPAFIDVELYPNYFCLGIKINGKFLSIECGEGKSFNPKFLSWVMQNYRTVGFNSIKYDLNIIWLAYANQDTMQLKEASNDLILNNVRTQDLKKLYNFFTYKTSHVDLIEVAPLKGSLKLYGARLHSPRIQDLPFPDYQGLTENEIEIVKQYNYNDLDVTEQLFDFMKERLELRETMGIEYNEDLMSKSDAQIAEVVLAKEVGKINGKRPQRPTIEAGTIYRYSIPKYIEYQSANLNKMLGQIRVAKFVVNANGKIDLPEELKGSVQIGKGTYRLGIGGLHSSEKTVAYKSTDTISIVDRDVRSYYPKIVTTLGLCPHSLGPAFLEVYEKIIAARLQAKEKKQLARDKGLKICINGAGGKFSDVWSAMYSPDLTIQMTVTGQLALLMLIEMVELAGIEVVSANTDGIVMIVGKDKEDALAYWIKEWEQRTGFETEETRYSGYYARDCNAYFAVKLDGTCKVKGSYAEVGSASGTKLDANPQTLICSDAVEALLSKGIPIEQTIRECKDFTRFITVRQVKGGAHKNKEYLGKVVRWAYIRGEDSAIHYVQTGNKVAETDGAVPFMDLPQEWPDLDYEWYIRRTRNILEDIGHSPKPKQIDFF